jgi:nucleotide-binding universal stress UspA family protein
MKPVLAGIDGSPAAIVAALWAVDEAISRGVPLRLVSVIAPTHPAPDDYTRDLTQAETSLREARAAIEASGKPVAIDTDILRGPPGPVLVEATSDADLVCVGSVGIGRFARAILGSTATELAERAHCPVAILRTDLDRPPPDVNWIVVRMTGAPDNEIVVKHAVGEARLRRAPMLVLGGDPDELSDRADGRFVHRVEEWRRRHPEVRVYPITTNDAIGRFLSDNDERAQLAVISGTEAGQLARLLGPTGHALYRHPGCSVLVIR